MKQLFLPVLMFTTFFCAFLPAKAELYFRPSAGIVVPISGDDPAYTLGVAGGYNWSHSFATELQYSRILGTGSSADGDIFTGRGIFTLSKGFFTPYASAGGGMIHASLPGKDQFDPLLMFGAGVQMGPMAILVIGVGLEYNVVFNGPDYLQPAVSVGLRF